MTDVVCYGLGPIGLRIAGRILQRKGLKLIAAVDVDPDKRGKDLGELMPLGGKTGVQVVSSVAELPDHHPGAVAVHATTSAMKEAAGQFEELARSGFNVVTTCEEMTFPALDAATSKRIDEAAKAAGVSILGSGINPGFLLDSLPLVLSSACVALTSVSVRRVVDTNQRRIPLQRKVGVGMSVEEFKRLAASGKLGHVGLQQSALLLAEGLGWHLDDYSESLDPVVANREMATGLGTVPAGGVIGQHQVASGKVGGREVIRYELDMLADGETIDAIEIDGEPNIRQEIRGGVNGDIGTEAIVANLIPVVASSRPGLLTMMDVLLLRCQQ